MSSFAERYGYRPVRTIIQRESMDDPLRNSLWDLIWVRCFENVRRDMFDGGHDEQTAKLIRAVWRFHFKLPTDTIPSWFDVVKILRKNFMTCEWYDAYSFVESIAKWSADGESLRKYANQILTREMSAFRFVESDLVAITDDAEIAEIESAIQGASMPVRTHLRAALSHLSDRDNPDYRNSVKESISAVEAVT